MMGFENIIFFSDQTLCRRPRAVSKAGFPEFLIRTKKENVTTPKPQEL